MLRRFIVLQICWPVKPCSTEQELQLPSVNDVQTIGEFVEVSHSVLSKYIWIFYLNRMLLTWKTSFHLSHRKDSSWLRENVVCNYILLMFQVVLVMFCALVDAEVLIGSWFGFMECCLELHPIYEEGYTYQCSGLGLDCYPYKYELLDSSDKALLLTVHFVKVVQCGRVASDGLVSIYWWRCIEVFLKPFTKCSRRFSYVLIIAVQLLTFVPINSSTLYFVFILWWHGVNK